MSFKLWLESTEKDIKKSAGLFLTDGKQFLAIQYEPNSHSGKWTTPGGHLKSGETALEGAKRETKEECGYNHGKVFDKIIEDGGRWTSFLCIIDKPFKAKLSKEHTNSKWVDLDNWKELDFHPFVKQSLQEHIDKIKKYIKKNESDLDTFWASPFEPSAPDNRTLVFNTRTPPSKKARKLFGKKNKKSTRKGQPTADPKEIGQHFARQQ